LGKLGYSFRAKDRASMARRRGDILRGLRFTAAAFDAQAIERGLAAASPPA
jgi:hypothetical protein